MWRIFVSTSFFIANIIIRKIFFYKNVKPLFTPCRSGWVIYLFDVFCYNWVKPDGESCDIGLTQLMMTKFNQKLDKSWIVLNSREVGRQIRAELSWKLVPVADHIHDRTKQLTRVLRCKSGLQTDATMEGTSHMYSCEDWKFKMFMR